jgi:hypothetical protein
VPRRERPYWAELLLLIASSGCQTAGDEPARPTGAASASAARLREALAPRATSPFVCDAEACRQEYPRLPDTGQWTCAERGRIVWCVGGEPAAGVVGGPPDTHFRCGQRFGQSKPERVCVDEQPEYPASAESFACRFEQESGLTRVCRRARAEGGPFGGEPVVPACWYDKDCASGACDRGACTCSKADDCERGRCAAGRCVESGK